jgi:hypothetical protein
LYASSYIREDKSRLRLLWNVACMGKMRSKFKISVKKLEEKRPLRRPKHRCEDNREIGREGVDWMHLTQGRDQWQAFVSTVMNLRVP